MYLPIAGSGKQSTEWTKASLDLSSYAGKTLAAFGLAFDPNETAIADYQMNIGEISINDDQAVPDAPTGLKIDKAFNSTETYISWDLADYSDVEQYNVYAEYEDGTEVYLGGAYNDMYYIKDLYTKEGKVTIKVTAENANGVESAPATIVRDLDAAPSELKAEAKEGSIDVSWTNGTADYTSIRAEMTFANNPYDHEGERYTATFEKGATTGTVPVPVTDGSNYYLRLSYLDAEGKEVVYTDISGQLVDNFCEPYEGIVYQHPLGKGWTIDSPKVYDWWHLTAWDSNGNVLKNNVTRGVDDLTGLSLQGESGYIEVQLEDFAGNKSERTRVYYGEPPKTNKTLLQKTVEYAETLNTEGVVDSAVEIFEKALAEAKVVLDNEYASQEEINAAWDNLLEGIWGLGLVQGDKTTLDLLIERAEAMDESKYVSDNWQQLVDALANAKAVYEDGDAMDEDIQPVAEALLNAILAQRYKADKSILEDLINQANEIDTSLYTAESVQAFTAALKSANAILADESLSEDEQATVDEAVATLSSAMDNLEKLSSDNGNTGSGDDNKDDNNTSDKDDTSSKDDPNKGPISKNPATGDNNLIALGALAVLLTSAGAFVVIRRKSRA